MFKIKNILTILASFLFFLFLMGAGFFYFIAGHDSYNIENSQELGALMSVNVEDKNKETSLVLDEGDDDNPDVQIEIESASHENPEKSSSDDLGTGTNKDKSSEDEDEDQEDIKEEENKNDEKKDEKSEENKEGEEGENKEEEEEEQKLEERIVKKKSGNVEISIIEKFIDWGYSEYKGEEDRDIDAIIIHSAYDSLGEESYDIEGLLKVFKQYEVSAHYLIGRKGDIYKLVRDKDIAFHAGKSKMPTTGKKDVNKFSIGIELLNKEDDQFTDEQYASLNNLVAYLKSKYKVKSKNIVGHKDIAPERKTDPWNFDWGKLVK